MIGDLRTYAVFTLDLEGTIDSWNAGVRQVLGYEEDEFVGMDGGFIFTPEDRAAGVPAREMAAALGSGEAADDRWHVRKDGSRLWVNGIMHCVRDQQGAALGFLKIMRDQTAKRVLDARLRESEERFSKAFHANPTPTAIVSLSEGLRVVDVNASLLEAFGLERDEAVGATLAELGLRVQADELEAMNEELGRRRTARFEAAFRMRDDGEGRGMVALEPVELGGQPHAVMLMHDVTPWHAANAQLEQQNEFVNAILDSLPGVFYVLDEGHLVKWNEELERVTGMGPAQLAEAKADDVVVEAEAVREHIEAALRTGEAWMEGHMRGGDGAQIPYLLTGRLVVRDGKPYVLGIGVEITEQVRARRLLERQAKEQRVFADLTAAALEAEELAPVLETAVRDVAETIGADHVRVHELTDEGERVYRHHTVGEQGGADAPPPDVLGFASSVRGHIQGRERTFGFLEAFSYRSGFFTEEDESFVRSVAYLLAGAVEQLRLYRELTHRADHDDLTGLLTRVAFERRLVQALDRAARTRTKVAVLFLDLDRFKSVNDALGHQAGDEVIRAVARRLVEAVRSWDVLARHGGDEFVLFLPDIESNTEIAHVTQRLLDAFDTPFKVGGRELSIKATVGVASFPDDGKDAATLLWAADTALYEGKARGRDTFHFFTREQHERVLERLEFEEDLHHALEKGEFELHYQAQVDLVDGSVPVAEALIRWRHPKRGHLLPAAFLPVVDQIGLAAPVGEWTLKRAFFDHVAWRDDPAAPERVAVNVSPLHFLQPSFPELLLRQAGEAGLAPSAVEVEIDERCLLKDPELVAIHLRALADNGVRTVIDDFGTYAAPLSRLRELPISRLKVDGDFSRAALQPRGRSLLEAVVQMARSLGIEPIAEGVETAAQGEALRDVGFRAAQGRFYAEELPVGKLLERLRAR